ncbi:MAG TPA: SpoIIE family protein phosphatase [Bryobacteraceae bacterium]|nr:SpoIIE family protein phosphatase [Bryobacteraceae bacterium]
MTPALVIVDGSSRVAEARRLATTAARAEGLEPTATEEAGIIATELATNLVKHAASGELHITRLSHGGDAGVEILSIDRGPGMANVPLCMMDGYSTTGTAGTGLGAVSRLASAFDGYSQPGRGTVIAARKYRDPAGKQAERWVFGAVTAPYPGETVCGDNWSARHKGHSSSIIVADGLGHGVLASDASSAAIATFRTGPSESAVSMLEDVHRALRPTRGAAVAVSFIEHEKRQVHYAGIGNIAGVVLGGARAQFMVSHNGTAGLEARRLQEFDYKLPEEAILVMHSDGIATSWTLDPYPGVTRRHPSIIAGLLYRDASRGRDDVCVLVGKYFRE